MTARTFELDEEAIAQLEAEQRAWESFSDTIKRITSEVGTDWRDSIGRYGGEAADAFEAAVERSREATKHGLERRQRDANDLLDEGERRTGSDRPDD